MKISDDVDREQRADVVGDVAPGDAAQHRSSAALRTTRSIAVLERAAHAAALERVEPAGGRCRPARSPRGGPSSVS